MYGTMTFLSLELSNELVALKFEVLLTWVPVSGERRALLGQKREEAEGSSA